MGDDLSISKSSPSHSRQMREVRRIVPHRRYSAESLQNDIAMIFVRTKRIGKHFVCIRNGVIRNKVLFFNQK